MNRVVAKSGISKSRNTRPSRGSTASPAEPIYAECLEPAVAVEEVVSTESVEVVREAFLRSLFDFVSPVDRGSLIERKGEVRNILGCAVLQGALPRLAARLDGEADALVVAEGGGRGGGAGAGGLGTGHCEGLDVSCGGG